MKPRIFKSQVLIEGYWAVEGIGLYILYFYSWERALLAVKEYYRFKKHDYEIRTSDL